MKKLTKEQVAIIGAYTGITCGPFSDIHRLAEKLLERTKLKLLMKNLKVLRVCSEVLEFENGFKLYSEHRQDCCEDHYLSFGDLSMDDFDGLQFDLSNDNFFKKIEGYGIELIPIEGHSVKIPGYGSNNGYYSSDLELVLTDDKGFTKEFDITECQSQKDWA